jgi:alpha/beta superfamily hydrolase
MMTTRIRVPVPGDGIELEACVGPFPPSAVVAPPHPLYGGHRSNPVVTALCEGLSRRGIGALAFNWRGVGASGGRPSGDPGLAMADYAAALAYVKATATAPLPWVAAGYSFGAATALAVAARDPSIREIVVVAPPVAMLAGVPAPAARACRVTLVAAAYDEFAPLDDLRAVFASVADARIVVVEGADHFFSSGGLEVVVAAASKRLDAPERPQ